MELLSSEYGWKPDDIREMRVSDIENYIIILNCKRKEANKNNNGK
jgi:hypothetical protein